MNSKQEEFDAVVDHLYTQGRPAKNGNLCAYRSAEGLSCAVGCRIPDEVYDAVFEGSRVCGLLKWAEKHHASLPPEISAYHRLFDKLQEIHDTWDASEDGSYHFSHIAGYLKELANIEDLTFTDPRRAA